LSNSFRFLGLIAIVVLGAVSLSTPAGSIAKTELTAFEACPLASNPFITWSPAEIECPICKTKNTFMVWGSYGSYIYQFPSKYQLVFWPHTDSQSWYSCQKCRYTAFMGNFADFPQEKIAELQKLLEGERLSPQKGKQYEEVGKIAPYLSIPVSDRLRVIEKIDRLLGHTGDQYLSHFYRVLAYHLAAEQKQTDADEARRKVLSINERQLNDKANEGLQKDLMFIAGAMHHFLRDDVQALKDFEAAKKLKYANGSLKAEQNKNYNEYLSHLIDEYLDLIRKGKGPRERTDNAFID